jgi:hypothetical protein
MEKFIERRENITLFKKKLEDPTLLYDQREVLLKLPPRRGETIPKEDQEEHR